MNFPVRVFVVERPEQQVGPTFVPATAPKTAPVEGKGFVVAGKSHDVAKANAKKSIETAGVYDVRSMSWGPGTDGADTLIAYVHEKKKGTS